MIAEDVLIRFDAVVINLVGLRSDMKFLPDSVIREVLNKAITDLKYVVRFYDDVEVPV